MRYNQESLRLASRKSIAHKEGRLDHKAPRENYRSRVVRLRSNLLFFFRLNDTGTQVEREPHGWLLLEDVTIKIEGYSEKPFSFSIVCGGDVDRGKHWFSASSQQDCNDWVTRLQQASMSHLQSQIRSLSALIEKRTRGDPLENIVERIQARSQNQAKRNSTEQKAQHQVHLSQVRQSTKPITGYQSTGPTHAPVNQSTGPAHAPVNQSTGPAPIAVARPSRKAPPPPAAAIPKQNSTWFADLQTLEPQPVTERSTKVPRPKVLSHPAANQSIAPNQRLTQSVPAQPKVFNDSWLAPAQPSINKSPSPTGLNQPASTGFNHSRVTAMPKESGGLSSIDPFDMSGFTQSRVSPNFDQSGPWKEFGASFDASQFTSSAPPVPPPRSKSSKSEKRASSTWFTDVDAAAWQPKQPQQQQQQQPQLTQQQPTFDPFGMDSAFNQSTNQTDISNQFQNLQVGQSDNNGDQGNMNFNWTKFE